MGEFNINKSDGSLEQTAGMPETYPATQVMMSDGETSVEDALSSYHVVKSVTADGTKTYKQLINSLFDGVTYTSSNPDIMVKLGSNYFHLSDNESRLIHFTAITIGSTSFTLFSIIYYKVTHASSAYRIIKLETSGNNFVDQSDTVPTSGMVMSILTR